jgi:hypothetical protein
MRSFGSRDEVESNVEGFQNFCKPFSCLYVGLMILGGVLAAGISSLIGHAVECWLKHYATNWKVADSIPDEVTGLFG